MAEGRGLLTMLAILLIALVATGYSREVDPLILIFASLRLHLAVALLLVGLLLLVTGAWARSALAAALALAALGHAFWALSPLVAESGATTGAALKVISFNVRWDNRGSGPEIADFLAASDAQIVVLLEATPVLSQLGRLKAEFPYQQTCASRCGVVLLSKLPLQNATMQKLTTNSPHSYVSAKVEVGAVGLSVVGLQFARPYDARTQVSEFQALARIAADLPEPAIVMGDFNSGPWSPWFVDMLDTGGLRRAALEPGTWPVDLGDWGEPIDHILVKGARLEELSGFDNSFGSNHRGLMARLVLPGS